MLKVLCIRQPWADAIMSGRKPVENRTWHTAYRGELAILASRKVATRLAYALCGDDLPNVTGAVIGVVEIYDVVTAREYRARGFDARWWHGPYGLMLRKPRLLKVPVAWKGQLRPFTAPEKLETLIRGQMK